LDVELLYFAGCPQWRTAADRVRRVGAECGAVVRLRDVTGAEETGLAGFAGSPTILIDGHDAFPRATAHERWRAGCTRHATDRPDRPRSTRSGPRSPTFDRSTTADGWNGPLTLPPALSPAERVHDATSKSRR
jgi:hypothetical protein